MAGFQPIETACFVELGTVAFLKMADGSIVRAIWDERPVVRCDGSLSGLGAWWPTKLKSPQAKDLIGLYDPVEWWPVSAGEQTSH